MKATIEHLQVKGCGKFVNDVQVDSEGVHIRLDNKWDMAFWCEITIGPEQLERLVEQVQLARAGQDHEEER